MAVFNGTAGNDTLTGTSGADTISGFDGSDTISGLEGNDRIITGNGNDSVEGGAGNDEINAFVDGNGNLLTYPSSGNLQLHGGAGNDTIAGGSGNDSITGGDGNDYMVTAGGTDTVLGGPGNDWINGYLEGGNVFSYPYAGAATVDGGDGDDVVVGTIGADSLQGGAGSDTLMGHEGSDTLDGGAGVDELWGGTGDDTYHLSRDDRVVDEGGNDTAIVMESFTKLPDFVENISYAAGVLPLPYWIDAMLPRDSSGQYFESLLGASRTLYYTFPSSLPSYDVENGQGYAPLTAGQVTRVTQALDVIEGLVDVQFAQGADTVAPNTLAFANNIQVTTAGYAYQPSELLEGYDVFFNLVPTIQTLADGTYGATVLMHEVGHALGLKHPTPGAEEAPFLSSAEADAQWTVMAGPTQDTGLYTLRYGVLDIAALQYLYGPSKTARTGNDTHQVSQADTNFIWDGGGNDTLDASDATQGVTLYLTPGYWGYVGNAAASTITADGQVTVNFGTTIENATGSPQADRLYGNEVANTLRGNGGNDTLDGGAGIDFAAYSGTYASNAVARGASSTTVSGGQGTDTLTGIERLQFSDAKVAIDFDGAAGSTVKLLGALLGDWAVDAPSVVGVALSFFDAGLTYDQVAQIGLDYMLGGNVTNQRIVDLLWTNVVGSAPTAQQSAPFVQMLDTAAISVPGLVTLAADLSLNLDRIGYSQLSVTGVEYL